jgi:predicted nucleic acid-binding Zn ribbon protein
MRNQTVKHETTMESEKIKSLMMMMMIIIIIIVIVVVVVVTKISGVS